MWTGGVSGLSETRLLFHFFMQNVQIEVMVGVYIYNVKVR